MAKKMRAVQVPEAKGLLELVEREIPEPKPGWVRVKVEACGICHSDSLVKEMNVPAVQSPIFCGGTASNQRPSETEEQLGNSSSSNIGN